MIKIFTETTLRLILRKSFYSQFLLFFLTEKILMVSSLEFSTMKSIICILIAVMLSEPETSRSPAKGQFRTCLCPLLIFFHSLISFPDPTSLVTAGQSGKSSFPLSTLARKSLNL